MISPTLTTLNRLHDWSRQGGRSAALGELGLFLHANLGAQGYAVSPTNAYAFASTGGDGVTFSLLDIGPGLDEASPVVMTVPMALGDDMQANWVLGQDLREFLALGLDTGYFALEELAYDPQSPQRISDARGDRRPPVLAELAVEFGLSSWTDVRGRLDHLSRAFTSALRTSPPGGRRGSA